MNSTEGDIEASLDFIRSMSSKDILLLNIENIVAIIICSITGFTIPIIVLNILNWCKYQLMESNPGIGNNPARDGARLNWQKKLLRKTIKYSVILVIMYAMNLIPFTLFVKLISFQLQMPGAFLFSALMLIPESFALLTIKNIHSSGGARADNFGNARCINYHSILCH